MKTIPALPKSGMKLKIGQNNRSLFTGILFIFIFAGFTTAKPFPAGKLNGVWQYRAIVKNGTHILQPTRNDTMLLNSKNSTFHYQIKSLNKDLGGTYKLISSPADSSPFKKTLRFQYKPSNNIRNFHIMLLSNDSLVIREGNTSFHYSKKRL
jgi:hypothetical protein